MFYGYLRDVSLGILLFNRLPVSKIATDCVKHYNPQWLMWSIDWSVDCVRFTWSKFWPTILIAFSTIFSVTSWLVTRYNRRGRRGRGRLSAMTQLAEPSCTLLKLRMTSLISPLRESLFADLWQIVLPALLLSTKACSGRVRDGGLQVVSSLTCKLCPGFCRCFNSSCC